MARGKSSFRGKVSANAAQQRNKTTSYGHLMLPRGVPIFKEEGDSRVNLDILPYLVTDPAHPDRDAEMEIAVKGSLWYRRPYKLHRNIGVENSSVVCLTSIGQKCPICEYRKKLLDDGANWQDESVRQLRASNRCLYYVQPKGEKKLDDAPHLWDVSQFCFQDKLNNELEENEDYSVFPDLDEGLTLRIRFSEEMLGKNKFAETSRIDFEPRGYKYDEADIERLASLDDVLVVKTYREIEHLFYEDGEGAGDDESADEKPIRRQPDPDDDDAEKPAARSAGRPAEGTRRRRDEGEQPERSKPAEATSSRRRREPEEEKPEAPPADERAQRRAAAREAQAKEPERDDRCPKGHVFGRECDSPKHIDDCEKCPVWNDCMDELERLQKAA